MSPFVGEIAYRLRGIKADPSQPVSPNFQYLTSGSSVLILILTIAVVCMALIDIFLYKNRKLQMRIALGAILLSLLNIFLFYRETKSFVQGNYDLSAIFSLAVPVFLILAASGIYKDEKLVKSMDKLR